mgnify:CR=1 FL=1
MTKNKIQKYFNGVITIWALTIMSTLCAEAQTITTKSQVIDCGQVIYRNPVTAQFELVNEGGGSLTIKNVDTSCGCTTVNYPKGPISENKPFVVTVTYDARMMGHFEKYIDVYTSGASLPYTLTLRGEVVEQMKGYQGDYKFMLGKLKADKNEILFDDVNMGDNPTAEIHIANSTGDMATPVLSQLPEYLRAEVSPSSIAPGGTGVIKFTLESKKIPDYGLSQAVVYLGQRPGDRVGREKEIRVEAILLPTFPKMSEQQLVYAPKLKVSENTLDLGSFEGKKRKKGTVLLENVGRRELEITSIQMFTTGITVELPNMKIPPGESTKLKITADRKELRGVKQQPKVLMITNDPGNPKVVITVDIRE